MPSLCLIHHRPLQLLLLYEVTPQWHRAVGGIWWVSQLSVVAIVLLWAASDTASWWVQSWPSSCSEHPAVGRGHKAGLQMQELR